MMKTKNRIWVNTYVSRDIDDRLRLAAARSRVSRSAIVREAMKSYLDKFEKGAKSRDYNAKNRNRPG